MSEPDLQNQDLNIDLRWSKDNATKVCFARSIWTVLRNLQAQSTN